jgi:hypothetical protein
MGEDGFNAMLLNGNDDEGELPESLYLPNLNNPNHSAGHDKNGQRVALRVGGDSFLPKPFTYRKL